MSAIYEVAGIEECKYFRRFGAACDLFMDIWWGLNLYQQLLINWLNIVISSLALHDVLSSLKGSQKAVKTFDKL